MPNEMAKKMTDEFLAVQGEQQNLKVLYLPQFRKILSYTKVAGYSQLENKVSAVVNYEPAARIPLVNNKHRPLVLEPSTALFSIPRR